MMSAAAIIEWKVFLRVEVIRIVDTQDLVVATVAFFALEALLMAAFVSLDVKGHCVWRLNGD